MTDSNMTINRRAVFAAGALGALASVALPSGRAEAAEMGELEKANVKLVGEFAKAWEASPPDAVAIGNFLAEDCKVTWPGRQPLMGRAAAVEMFKKAIGPGAKNTLGIKQTIAYGPVVVHQRIDVNASATNPGKPLPIVAVYVIKNGKIQEWDEWVAVER